MKRIYPALFLLVAILAFNTNVTYASAQTITTFDPPNSTGTFAVAINLKGQIAGTYTEGLMYSSTFSQRGFLRERDGTFTTFQPEVSSAAGTFGLYTWVTDLNLEGEIVGYYLNLGEITTSAFLRRKDGTIVERLFNVIGGGSPLASVTSRAALAADPDATIPCDREFLCIDGQGAFAINALGEIAGVGGAFTYTGLLQRHNRGTIEFNVVTPSGTSMITSPQAINLFGQIAGDYVAGPAGYQGFLRQPNGTIVTFDPPGSTDTEAESINLFSQIAGYFTDSSGVRHGFLREPNGDIVTFDPPGSTGTEAESINVLGEITGFYFTADGKSHGFLRSAKGDIETFDAPYAGSVGTFAKEISDRGEIVGYYEDGNSVVHGFVRSRR